jgi:hypothetical protein
LASYEGIAPDERERLVIVTVIHGQTGTVLMFLQSLYPNYYNKVSM